jgi:hypothetical protein
MSKYLFKIAALLLLFSSSCGDPNEDVVFNSVKGVYKCQENSVHSGFKSYLVELDSVKNQENLFIILNFHNSGENEFLYAIIRNDSILIENQLINNMFITGEGTISKDLKQMDVFYLTDDGLVQLDYYAKYFR